MLRAVWTLKSLNYCSNSTQAETLVRLCMSFQTCFMSWLETDYTHNQVSQNNSFARVCSSSSLCAPWRSFLPIDAPFPERWGERLDLQRQGTHESEQDWDDEDEEKFIFRWREKDEKSLRINLFHKIDLVESYSASHWLSHGGEYQRAFMFLCITYMWYRVFRMASQTLPAEFWCLTQAHCRVEKKVTFPFHDGRRKLS